MGGNAPGGGRAPGGPRIGFGGIPGSPGGISGDGNGSPPGGAPGALLVGFAEVGVPCVLALYFGRRAICSS